MNALERLQEHLVKMRRISQAVSLFEWDMDTIMPKEGFVGHLEAMTYFSTELFRLSTAPELKEILEELAQPENFAALDAKWQFIVEHMLKDLKRDSLIPEDLYQAFVAEASEARVVWKQAKAASDYSMFAPHLAKLIEYKKQMYALTDPDKEIYDAMLNRYEEGLDSATLDRIFGDLKRELLPLMHKILAAPQPDESIYEGFYDIDQQKKVQKLLLDTIGFDWSRGAVGETEHPFTMNFNSRDVRITNHYYEDDPYSSIFSAIHEGGHAIFEQNINPDYDNTVAGSCSKMGLHESQSRMYENILGRNPNFWAPIYSKVQELMPEMKKISLEQFIRRINLVKNTLIRIHADELSYCFHIIIRYELEQAIFRQGVGVEELPALWNQKMEEYLMVTPGCDREGILQDSHWSGGDFGYFPSYLLGSVYDGMYLDQINKELGDVDELLREGRMLEITKYLNEKIHQYGNTRTSAQVIREMCGKEVSAEPLIRYFKEKYTALYQLED